MPTPIYTMTPQNLELLRRVQAEVEHEEDLQRQSARYRNAEQKLFESVVSRVEHVISELLQNADDAEATKVRIDYNDGELFFRHDGKDFADEQFRAICSFAVSSKRTIKSTGFRGIGFKSTFSLGDTVYVITPRFQVKFERARFTYPVMLGDEKVDPEWPITIRAHVKQRAQRELRSSLDAWCTAPCSLLFFRNLKGGVMIADDKLKIHESAGNTAERIITRNQQPIWKGHLVSKGGIRLPEDACEEIALLRGAERDSDQNAETQLDILISKEERGRIYSILPTSGEKRLQVPFALNGSFVLTPERDGIKSPSQSATNRFLFAEAGRIVADELLRKSKKARAFNDALRQCYELLPLAGTLEKPDPETEATREVREACLEQLRGQDWIVTLSLELACPEEGNLVALPEELTGVWPAETVHRIFSPEAPIIHPSIPKVVAVWLAERQQLRQLSNEELLTALTQGDIPRPATKKQLFQLWTWAARVLTTDAEVEEWSSLNLLPAEGSSRLRCLGEVYHVSRDTLRCFKDNGINLRDFGIYRLDTKFIEEGDLKLRQTPQSWWDLMDGDAVAITKESSLSMLLEGVARDLTDEEERAKHSPERIRKLWRIHCESGIPLSKNLPIARQNGEFASLAEKPLLLKGQDKNDTAILPQAFREAHLLAESWYPEVPAEREKFAFWMIEKNHAAVFPVPLPAVSDVMNLNQANRFAAPFGSNFKNAKNGSFWFEDRVWPESLLTHWSELSAREPDLFRKILQLVRENWKAPQSFLNWEREYGGWPSTITAEPAIPCSWARFFSDKNCLRSKSGDMRHPRQLYLTNSATLALINAGEPEVDPQIQQAYGAELLRAVGCNDSLPALPKLTELIRGELSGNKPDINRLTWLLTAADTSLRDGAEEKSKGVLLDLLIEHRSIPSTKGTPETPDRLVQDPGDDGEIPAVIPALRGTTLIAALGIRQSPSRESDITWIDAEIDTDVVLTREKLRKLRRLLSQPSSVSEHLWGQRRWLALDSTVRSLDDLAYSHADLKELPVENITNVEILAQTADFGVISPLPPELQSFSKPALLSCLQSEVPHRADGKGHDCEWLPSIAQVLWTEAQDASDHQAVLESVALRWRDTQLVLDPNLSRRFVLAGRTIASGIAIDAGWAAEDCFAVRATDEDEVCELTDEIARRLREPIATLRTKTGTKLAAWISRREGQIMKLGLKTLGLTQLRPWPVVITKGDPTDSLAERTDHQNSGLNTRPTAEIHSPSGTEVADNLDGERSVGRRAVQGVNGAGRRQSVESGGHSALSGYPADENERDTVRGQRNGDSNGRMRGHRAYTVGSGSGERRASSEPAQARDGWVPPAQSPERMRSYVEHSLNHQEGERQRTQAQEDGAAAEERVVEWEQKHGRSAIRLGGNNPGYDITSKSKDGADDRYIEVKSIAGEWGGTGVRLTPTQFAYAEQLGENYWLYVVEDAKTEKPIIHAIQNPAAHISAFCFDCGWRDIAEATATAKPPSLFIPEVGDTVFFDDDEVVVEKVETRGVFVQVTFQHHGRTIRKMNTVLSPKS